jgi:hypothetical protein
MGRGERVEGGKRWVSGKRMGRSSARLRSHSSTCVVELHVPNEFVVRGHVVVSDHAAIPTGTELHSDVSSDEVMGEGKGGSEGGRGWSGRHHDGSRVGGAGAEDFCTRRLRVGLDLGVEEGGRAGTSRG